MINAGGAPARNLFQSILTLLTFPLVFQANRKYNIRVPMTQGLPLRQKIIWCKHTQKAINTTQGLPLRKNYLFINSKLAKVPGKKNYLLAQLITTFSRRPILEIAV